jgi:uncharacterized membrane protein YoaK (UPF0700 family)
MRWGPILGITLALARLHLPPVVAACFERPDPWLSFGLAFVGGYGDAAGFVLAKTFTGHVTGNLVLGAISVAAGNWRLTLAHLSAIITFLIAVFLGALLMRRLTARPSWPPLSTIMGIEAILMVAASSALASHVPPGVEIFVVCMSLALGLQNGAFRRAGGISVHTTFLTGMITGLISSAAEKYSAKAPPLPETAADFKVRFLALLWIAFILGAAAGAVMVFRFKELGILGAALILLAIILRNSLTGSFYSVANDAKAS